RTAGPAVSSGVDIVPRRPPGGPRRRVVLARRRLGHRPGLALEQVHALTHQQQRTLHGSVVHDCALKAEALDPSTIREAFTDLLDDITTSARAIATILQQATR